MPEKIILNINCTVRHPSKAMICFENNDLLLVYWLEAKGRGISKQTDCKNSVSIRGDRYESLCAPKGYKSLSNYTNSHDEVL